MPRLKSGSNRRLVLDIGSSALRLCELSQTKAGFQLTKYYQREMTIDPSLDEEARRQIRRETLKQLLKDAKVRSKKAIFGVPGQAVFTRTRALPPVPEHKVTQIVRYEIQQQIPFALDQIALDYQVLGRTEAGGYDVLMAAIKVDVVDKHIDLLQDVKRTPDVVDVAPLAAYNWLKHSGEFGDQGDCVALIDVGAATTDIVIERENQFRFTRSLNLGGNDITAAIARNFNMSFAEAEKLKRERGFAPTGDAQRDGKGGEVIGQILQRLVVEVSKSFSYFRSQPGGGPVSRVILTGGTASLRNIVPFLQRQLGIDVRIAQPLAGLAIGANAQEVNEHPEQATVVLGLALRGSQSVPIEVNLIPPRILEAARRREQAFYIVLSFVTVALILASIVPLSAKRNELVLKEIESLKAQIGNIDPKLQLDPNQKSTYETDLDQAQKQIDSWKQEIDNLDKARNDRKFWLDELAAVNAARPVGKGLWFSSVQTAVIGGPQNTEDTGAGASAAPTPAASAAPRPSSGGLLGGGMMGGMMGGMGVNPMGAPGAAGDGTVLDSIGFPGLEPQFGAATGGMGGGMGAMPAAAPGGPDAPEPQPAKPIVPNGLTIFGYADSPETIRDFVAGLKANKMFLEGAGVYLDEAVTKKVPITDLLNAPMPAGGTVAQAGPSGGFGNSSSDDDDDPRSRRRSMSGGFNTGQSYRQPGASPYGNVPVSMVTFFRVDVQFRGKPQEIKEAPRMANQRAGGGGGMGGFGMRGRHNRDDEEE